MQRTRDHAAAALTDVLARMRRAPWLFSFTALMRRIGAQHPELPRIGTAARPQQEPFRLGQKAALSFAPREIAEVVLPANGVDALHDPLPPAPTGNNPALPLVRLYGLGMLGPNGPLPLHFTEIVRDRSENHHDGTLADFLDLFHHRYLTLLYRASAQGQAAAGLDRPEEEVFSAYVARLTGHDPQEIRPSAWPAHARLAASAHLCRDARHPDGLAATLARFFSVPVQLLEFQMHWIELDEVDQTRLGQPSASSVLGSGAIAGEVVPDRQSRFRLVLGPLSLEQYLRFTPQGRDLPLLVEAVRAFIGFEFLWDVELRVLVDDTPPARLEEGQKLGWSTWLGRAPDAPLRQVRESPSEVRHAVGMVFEPERYVGARLAVAAAP
ncbi:type VI secretion system baseplate subunit TssG [Variovorax sp. OV329]|uniref:type VI secretion system baseplate subunit TssG n=1 Tax=Variovorax sp. OV329 TaxID=1882825 RepID=UPI0008EEECDB|nr:type VI secretion system baseplate subunit TssG [Variovorax sp. OV329]SFN36165.1 type VI secretion system protein ImpH [Variovorax sp. OV329]